MATSAQIVAPVKESTTVTIAATGTVSTALSLGDKDFVGILLPSTFDGTTITFSVCETVNGTYQPLQLSTASVALSITTAASSAITLDPIIFKPWSFVKITSGSTQTTTDTVITCKLRAPLY
jgi:hypothetical protein